MNVNTQIIILKIAITIMLVLITFMSSIAAMTWGWGLVPQHWGWIVQGYIVVFLMGLFNGLVLDK
jgi:hypothetical protein